jgi:hypothetical protein
MTEEQLKEICRKYNIKTGKTKEIIVDNILKRVAAVHRGHTALETLRMRTKTTSTPDPAIIHNFYRAYFNLVDIADRYWNEVEDHHHHQNWKSKVLLMILRFAVPNLWVYVAKTEYQEWKEFRNKLAKEMVKFNTSL